jgi:hypothetical protein
VRLRMSDWRPRFQISSHRQNAAREYPRSVDYKIFVARGDCERTGACYKALPIDDMLDVRGRSRHIVFVSRVIPLSVCRRDGARSSRRRAEDLVPEAPFEHCPSLCQTANSGLEALEQTRRGNLLGKRIS